MSDDPAAVFQRVAATYPRAFWLDGGGSREWSGRRSLIGWLEEDDVSLTYDAARREVCRHRSGRSELVGADIFDCLAEQMKLDGQDASISWVGYFGYACRPDLPAQLAESGAPGGGVPGGGVPRSVVRDGGVPDAMWMRARTHLAFDHDPPDLSEATTPIAVAGSDNSVTFAEYAGWFDRVQEQLRLGNSYEVNLTYRRWVESDVDPVTAYLRLRDLNPAPYAGYLQHDGVSVLSSSPERFATIDRNRWVETKPVKGTTRRGDTVEEDARNRDHLASDPRFRSENLMIVDLLRNDLSMVCEPGTVTVPVLMEVESYASVHQLVSTVRGHLRHEVGTIEALRTLFPAGSMTGAPKLRTMEIIADVETSPRGVYAGALGWISGDGRADLGVVIRTLVVADPSLSAQFSRRVGQEVTGRHRYCLGTGGGITVRSDAQSEFEETLWKAARLLSVFE